MAGSVCFDWPGYFRGMAGGRVRALAHWLTVEGLGVGEFMDVVDRAYAAAATRERTSPRQFLAPSSAGRRAAGAHARRKRQFSYRLAVMDEALVSGALPGDVVPEELRLPTSPVSQAMDRRRTQEVLSALERARRALGGD